MKEPEKAISPTSAPIKKDENVLPEVQDAPEYYDPSQESRWTRAGLSLESFKKAPGITKRVGIATEDGEIAQEDVVNSGSDGVLEKNMESRHLNCIAVGGAIGTGLLISSGSALSDGGPTSMLIGWGILAVTLFCVINAIGELTILFPAEGGFYAMANRFIDQNVGYACGMLYALQWVVVLPLELTAIAQTIQYWDGNIFDIDTSNAVWISVFFGIIIIINLFGTKAYSEEEFFSAIVKLAVIILFIIAGVIFNCGGGPSSGDFGSYIGGLYYSRPGLTNGIANGFKGVCSVFVSAGFSYTGTELVGIAASETRDPVRAMPG